MSKPTTPRPNSQQKKTGMAIISDPISFKKPTVNDVRNDGNFKKPSINDLRGNTPNEQDQYKPPSISAMRGATPTDNFKKPSLSDMRSANPQSEGGYKRPTMADMQDIHVEFKVDPLKEDPHYKPYTVEEYRELQQMDDLGNNRGGLGPSFDDEWERKKEMRTRLMQFAQKAKEENKAVIPKRTKPRQEPKKGPSKHDKMKQYATKIPKPKVQPKNDKPLPKAHIRKPVEAKYDLNAELQRHAHFVQRVDVLRATISKYLD
ncbi:hypothetical protein TRFO_17355 [Tritrichomonas foetus]|uniref:Uncharacterized protein n=1 Tax=Tritrichomonas foetus TaxID=1144522 RepID=A0A1J4KNM0_9EUKA|nr:hypothetical protein TRFO_17355 [Tritrichomonas foetus]|eukprot:OHT12730.1 hypothetical protein TRFO_17355 [Tritrichomonas foetus]